MSFSPLLPVHISVGILGILSSATALPFRNGLPRHAQAGKVFILGPNHVKPRSCGLSPRLLSVLQPKKLVRACISDGGVWIDWTLVQTFSSPFCSFKRNVPSRQQRAGKIRCRLSALKNSSCEIHPSSAMVKRFVSSWSCRGMQALRGSFAQARQTESI